MEWGTDSCRHLDDPSNKFETPFRVDELVIVELNQISKVIHFESIRTMQWLWIPMCAIYLFAFRPEKKNSAM